LDDWKIGTGNLYQFDDKNPYGKIRFSDFPLTNPMLGIIASSHDPARTGIFPGIPVTRLSLVNGDDFYPWCHGAGWHGS
jgi:hypothetical protein